MEEKVKIQTETESDSLLPAAEESGSTMVGAAVVASTFLVYVPVAGFAQSFGVFVEMFDRDFCRPNSCLDLLGLVSALAIANFRLLCWLQVVMQRWLSVPTLFISGTVLCFLSMLLTSYVSSVYMLLATHSLLYGFGSTFMLNAPVTVIGKCFPEGHRFHVLASGIINLGPSVGVVVMNPLSVYLDETERYSWRDTLKVFGVAIFTVAAIHLVVLTRTAFCRRDIRLQTSSDTTQCPGETDPPACRSTEISSITADSSTSPWRPGAWLTCGSLCWLLGICGLSCVIFIPKTMFGISVEESAKLLSYSGVSETVASLLISFTGDFLGKHLMLLYALGATVLAASNGALPYITGELGLGTYCIVHGACDGLLMTVLYGVVTLVAPSVGSHDTLWCITNLVIGLGQIAGLPLAGYIYDVTKSYDFIFMMACAIFSTTACFFLASYAYITLRDRTDMEADGDCAAN